MTATATPVAPAAAPSGRRKLLVPLATLVAATGIAVASGATFSASTASTGLVASGTLTQSNSNSVAFNKGNLKPGDVVTGTVTVTNTGSLPALYTLTETPGSITFAPDTVEVQITDAAGAVVSPGTTDIGAAGTIPLGQIDAGKSRTFTWTVTFRSTADNSQQNKVANTTYRFDAGQTKDDTFTGTQSGGVTTELPATAPATTTAP